MTFVHAVACLKVIQHITLANINHIQICNVKTNARNKKISGTQERGIKDEMVSRYQNNKY